MVSDWVVKEHSNSHPATLKSPIIADVLNVIPSSEQNRSDEGLTLKISAVICFWLRLVLSPGQRGLASHDQRTFSTQLRFGLATNLRELYRLANSFGQGFTAFCDLRFHLATLYKSVRKFWFCEVALTLRRLASPFDLGFTAFLRLAWTCEPTCQSL